MILNKTLKVTNIYKTYYPDPPGGLQEAIRQICFASRYYGIQNQIFTLSNQPEPRMLTIDDTPVIREKSIANIASCDIGGVKAFQAFNALSAESDVLHLYHPWPFAEFLSLVGKKKPTIVTYISDIVRQKMVGYLYRPLLNKTLNDADAIVANCPSYVKTSPILSQKKLEHKIHIIPLGIDEQTYPAVDNLEFLNHLKVDYNQPYFLFLGVLRYYKGLHTLIEAAKSVAYPIYIAGSGPEGDRLKKLVNDLGIQNVIFLGKVSMEEKIMLIKHCQALILPSHLRSEAYGMVLVEAAMYGRPMISCEIGTGTSYVNQHEETGLVIAPENPKQLADAIYQLADSTLNLQLGHQARKRYEELFSGPALGRAYATLYQAVQ